MSKRINAIIVALVAMLMVNTSVSASPSTNNSETSQVKEDNTIQTSQTQSKSSDPINTQIQNLEISIEKLDSQIEQSLKDIDENNNRITKTESEMKNLQEQINEAENDIKDHKATLNKRARAFYINGIDGYMQVVMDSQNLGDFVSRIDSIRRVIGFDQQIITGITEKKQNIVSQKEKLQEENKKLLILKTDNEKKVTKLSEDKENEKKMIDNLQVQQKIIEMNNQLSNSSNNNSITSQLTVDTLPSNNNAVISYAYKFLGTPYLWGGTTPDGFDCSGFMQYIYANFGVKIGRTTYEQIKDGVEVSKDKLNPGDLVFFGTKEDPHHVGMYIGNGMYIHAPHTGDVIKVSVLASRNDYLTGRRLQ